MLSPLASPTGATYFFAAIAYSVNPLTVLQPSDYRKASPLISVSLYQKGVLISSEGLTFPVVTVSFEANALNSPLQAILGDLFERATRTQEDILSNGDLECRVFDETTSDFKRESCRVLFISSRRIQCEAQADSRPFMLFVRSDYNPHPRSNSFALLDFTSAWNSLPENLGARVSLVLVLSILLLQLVSLCADYYNIRNRRWGTLREELLALTRNCTAPK